MRDKWYVPAQVLCERLVVCACSSACRQVTKDNCRQGQAVAADGVVQAGHVCLTPAAGRAAY